MNHNGQSYSYPVLLR